MKFHNDIQSLTFSEYDYEITAQDSLTYNSATHFHQFEVSIES